MFFILALALVTACSTQQTDPENEEGMMSESSSAASSDAIQEELPEGSFGFNDYGMFYGDFYVEGYARVQEIPEAFCEENCTMYDYVSFVVMKTNNAQFYEFLEKNKGNSYTGEISIGLGCIENGVIGYSNHSDKLGMQEMMLSDDVSKAILDSSQENPIQLKLTKLELSAGRGAPTCYSHITTIEEWNGQ